MHHKIISPLCRAQARELHSGDSVLLSGVVYTARDAAHKRLSELIKNGEELPFPLEDAIIYYVGPTPSKPGQVIGSAGPTTSYRMDSYTPELIKLGVCGMIGKGSRSKEVVEAMKDIGAVYFGAIGGCGALLAKCVESSEVVAFEDLGAEAIRKLVVKDMPLTVIIDCEGSNLYDTGCSAYLNNKKEG